MKIKGLAAGSGGLARQAVAVKESSSKRLTGSKAAVECAASVETKGSSETLFNKLNQAIRVGACG
ncbi:hypothetical protein ACFSKY_14125 [Azotobacter chroococcum]|uniref:hypothetical protein n=1 Tax=Azotobacter chroococcum TaxID=353 RepID=UPI0013F155CD|nr:hypothetical protein [Azotobacter chroococcum]